MTFEKALEAMKQGKKVCRPCWNEYSNDNNTAYLDIQHFADMDIIAIHYSNTWRQFSRVIDFYHIPFDDWEIYEEPQKSEQIESYMSNAHAITVLEKLLETDDFLECARELNKCARELNTSVTGVCNCIKFAIQTIKEQNQPEPEKKCECKCLDKLEEVYKFVEYLYTECAFTPDMDEKVENCYQDLKDFLYYQRKNARG